jgi:hypothetical protein
VPLKRTGECPEPFDLDLTVEILHVTWHDVWPGNEPRFRLLKILGGTPRVAAEIFEQNFRMKFG